MKTEKGVEMVAFIIEIQLPRQGSTGTKVEGFFGKDNWNC